MQKRGLAVAAVIVTIGLFAANALAGPVIYDSDGTKSLTELGWTLAGTPSDQFTKSKDYSTGMIDGGAGVWNINDNNSPSNAYMRMWKDPSADNQNPLDPPSGGVDQSQGIVMARVKAFSGTSTAGTFGYSSAQGDHSITMAIRAGQINWKSAEGDNAPVEPVSLDTTSDYRVYAIAYGLGGTFNSWYSTTNDWSSNPADWVQVVTNGVWATQSAMVDETGTAINGLLMGSFGSSGSAWQGNVDWIAWAKDGDLQQPWALPEPASLLLLSLGGLLLRRRHA
jgi:hypothetical protein